MKTLKSLFRQLLMRTTLILITLLLSNLNVISMQMMERMLVTIVAEQG